MCISVHGNCVENLDRPFFCVGVGRDAKGGNGTITNARCYKGAWLAMLSNMFKALLSHH